MLEVLEVVVVCGWGVGLVGEDGTEEDIFFDCAMESLVGKSTGLEVRGYHAA